ncbi:MAG: periplasmic solute binding protein, partial [Verrucomicrobiaceae bacterium]|nr:periplasmic solute binding protein [Verrucomicrobiaceae bacterium]
VQVVEVGASLPMLKIQAGQDRFFDEDVDVKSGIDPHWWHSLDNLQRAARLIGEVLMKADPAQTAAYKAGVAATTRRLALLQAWAHVQLLQVPRQDRRLVTAHAAFGYFCREFGFQAMPLLGLSREDEATTKHVAQTVKSIRDNHIRAVFPEDQANPKILQEIVRETGVKLGEALVADGTSPTAHTVDSMFRHNVRAIVSAFQSGQEVISKP